MRNFHWADVGNYVGLSFHVVTYARRVVIILIKLTHMQSVREIAKGHVTKAINALEYVGHLVEIV